MRGHSNISLTAYFPAAIFLIACLVHVITAYEFYVLTDDAFIAFRYAKNLALGRGLVWNPGEYVEGYTSFLWVLLLAATYRLSLPLEIFASVWSLGATVGCLSLLYFITRRLFNNQHFLIFAVALVFLSLNRSWNFWATGGLETRLFTFLVILTIYSAFRGLNLFPLRAGESESFRPAYLATASFAGAFAILTRPDGLLLVTLLAAVSSISYLVIHRRIKELFQTRLLLCVFAPVSIIVASHFLFRLYYYGQWLPNTYYAKVGLPWPDMGFKFLHTFGREYALELWIPLVLILFAWRSSNHRRTILFFISVFAMLIPQSLYYACRVGGDFFEFRIFDIYWPFLALLMSVASLMLVQSLSGDQRPGTKYQYAKIVGGSCLLLWLLLQHFFVPGWRFFMPKVQSYSDSGVPYKPVRMIIGRWSLVPGLRGRMQGWKNNQLKLQSHMIGKRWAHFDWYWRLRSRQFQHFRDFEWPKGAVTADGGIGVLGYYCDLPIIDLLGLTDAVIARSIPARTNNSKRVHAHNRRPPPGYLEKRQVNVFPLCSINMAVKSRRQVYEGCPDVARYQVSRPLISVLHRGRYLIIAGNSAQELRRLFPGAVYIRSSTAVE